MTNSQNELQLMTIKILSANEENKLDDQCIGNNHNSPGLTWTKVQDAKSYAVVMIDYEATPACGLSYVHWFACNIKNNYLDFNDAKLNKDLIQSKPTGAYWSIDFTVPNTNELTTSYIAPFPPNAPHRYEIRVYALRNDVQFVGSSTTISMDVFDALINEAGIINYGVVYAHVPQLTLDEEKQVVKGEVYPLTLMKNETYTKIKDVSINHLWLNIFTKDMLYRFIDPLQCDLLIEDDASGAKAYAILITSNIGYQQHGTSIVHYAHIINKDDKQRFKFLNSYATKPDLLDINPKVIKMIGTEFAVVYDKNSKLTNSNEWYLNVSVFGLDKKINDLNKKIIDQSVAGMFDMIAGHTIAYANKYIKIKV
ncbi:YbhB/YbcL family Raf kinase inhibitor-like protein [Ureaplasma sp. ES3154-GEN]|uniref:YbhB/YbcL family Raf kinase inhibitor-like protein n=1 Tax=Ureaplasma sp. ES3154-GEN TaxID=2984844 RepID=UPI0021E995CC|nr:YbhB/YbcL family Raf kinase inhibitor-like protein [Ureaplasma sp. ES3154-GEN]MCV3743559.1 YbhB/YbcL family Raf kinase inhibitor-like protein [Ureaplasma sp. ES3154-GEN]